MLKQILTLFISLVCHTGLHAQLATDSLFKLADTYFSSDEYTQAIQVYRQIKDMSDSSSMDYAYAVDRIAMVYFQNRNAAREAKDTKASIAHLEEFLNFMEAEKAVLRPNWYERDRYEVIHLLLQDYFHQEWYSSAKNYQEILYTAHEAGKLPNDLQEFHSLGTFSYKDKNVWGYEYFQGLSSPTARGSLSKIVYAVFSQDEEGEDKDLLYQVHVKEIREIDESISKYVLAIRPELDTDGPSGVLWGFEYEEIEYKDLRNALEKIIDEEYEVR